MEDGVGFLIVMSKLYKYVITGFYFADHILPQALVVIALRAAASSSCIIHTDVFREELLEFLSPASLRLDVVQRIGGHGGIADGVDCDWLPNYSCQEQQWDEDPT